MSIWTILLKIAKQDRPEVLRQIGPEAYRQNLRGHMVPKEHPELARRRKLILPSNSLVSDEAVKQKIVDLDYAGIPDEEADHQGCRRSSCIDCFRDQLKDSRLNS